MNNNKTCLQCNDTKYIERHQLLDDSWDGSSDDTSYECIYCIDCPFCKSILLIEAEEFRGICNNCNTAHGHLFDNIIMYYDDSHNDFIKVYESGVSLIYWKEQWISCKSSPKNPDEAKKFIEKYTKTLILK